MTCTDKETVHEEFRVLSVSRTVSSSSDGSDETSIANLQFLRVHIGRYTAVVQKKPMSLREALQKKLKNQNMDIEKCVAFDKESNFIIDWEIEVDKITVDSIEVAQSSEEHQFTQKLSLKTGRLAITVRSCLSCQKRNLFLIYVCKKCNYTICTRYECKDISKQILCRKRRGSDSSLASSVSTFLKSQKSVGLPSIDSVDDISMGDPIRSEQILPLKEIKPCFSYRMRSSSDSEIKNASNDTVDKNNNKTQTLVVPNPVKRPKKISTTNSSKQKSSPRWDSIISCEIPFNQIKVEDDSNIGQGSFGTVKRAQDFYHGLVAIKFLNVQNPSEKQVNAFRNEMSILKSTRHDNILLFIGCILKPNLAIVTEFCPGSSLYRHIHVDENFWPIAQIVDIAKQTSIGMEYLHARGILHRDIKSNNLFLISNESGPANQSGYSYISTGPSSDETSHWKVKIGDFGLATFGLENIKKSVKSSSNPSGSVLWMAPEVITQKLDDPYSTKSDVYSFAVVLYELITGHLPFPKKEQNMIFFLVGAGRLKLDLDDARTDTPFELLDLITTCSKYNRDDRPDFVKINEILRSIRLQKHHRPILLRTESLPNIYFNSYNSYLSTKFVLKDNEAFTEIDLLNDSSF